MTARLAQLLVASLLVFGCSNHSESQTALASMKWHSADEMDLPHLNIVHIVELRGEGKILLDGRDLDENAAKQTFSKIAANEILAYIDFKPGCSDQSKDVVKYRKIIENSGACIDNFCICGGFFNYEEPPSDLNN